MAALVEGQQYGLSAQDNINCNKSVVFVKLTDSALRSIQDYVKYKGNTLPKPSIQFENNNGLLSVPTLNGGSNRYGFNLSNVEADGPQGSFECIQQIGKRSLESIGCMLMKMHIHANEDSYEKTRVKMAAAEQEHKKFCTKEIKPNGPHLGRKVKVKRPGIVVSPVKISSPPTTSTTQPPKISSFKSITAPPVKKPQEQPKFSKVAPKHKFANSPELLRQPIRDRIIHILAVRPYKRPELLVRLMNEGIREKDRKGISAILSQVGTLKGNVYTLANFAWNEVQTNWKFATQDELEIIRKRKQQFQNSSSFNESEVLSQPSSSPVQKRVLPEPKIPGQEPRIKKQRISHYQRPETTGSPVKSESSENSASDRIQIPSLTNGHKSLSPLQTNGKLNGSKNSLSNSSHAFFNGHSNGTNGLSENVNGKLNGKQKRDGSCSNSPHSSSDSRDSLEYNGSSFRVPPSNTSPSDNICSDMKNSYFQVPPPQDSPPDDVCPQYIKEYGTIESREQRAQYKADFNAQYEEYLRLHSDIKNISRKFDALEHHLHTCEEGSEEFKRIKGKIYKEYRAYQQDRNYIDALKKFNFLHGKLSHIKKLVVEYDNAQCVKS